MTPGAAFLSVLYLGGTGTISAACVRASVAAGHDVTVVTRGGDAKGRGLPEGVTPLVADVADPDALRQALGDRSFDAVVDFLSFDAAGADRRVDVFAGRTRQFVAISSASIYRKPALQTPITESTLRANPFLAYARDKIAMEDAFLLHHSTSGFPVVIVRPSHTYDEASPPLAGDWTVVDRIARGEEVVVPGDGTSLWTLTHADDFAVGLVGILGDERAMGEALHITSDDVMTWDRIHHLVADALGVEARIVHVPAEQFPVVEPDWGWSELVVGDLSHSAVFDTTRIRRLVPAFQPRIPFHLAVRGIVAWRAEHPELTRPDADTDRRIGRLVAAKHAADAAYRDAGAAAGAGGAGA
ncbi:NAD-dependent epimerase/dehydratase family protein [Clavibacter tessellarius]|uniref:Nucleotide sugar epimerase n=2 Tax=Clavibacter tessellarius TaxID=31965 RepID=A0A225CC91_9MICO|nr:NAD-dependent epimerase/dehydratase family protein [Clavibacter michiganensis]OQJ64298.1 nucleotide sugar epimerase [Clavibacter michiganensis subsp. tessellarius]UKF35212.1 NAD-dependent epimerase/dehydratase family protein [Clavibacter michiganensis subsp. tessellarius]